MTDETKFEVALSEAQIEAIAERAVEKVLTRIYAEVGKGVLVKAAWLAGLVVTGLMLWLGGKGLIKP